MKRIVEANGGSVVVGFWNEETNTFTTYKKLPRKLKKKIRKENPNIKIKKNILEEVIEFNDIDNWDSSFSLRISKNIINNNYYLYFNVCVCNKNEINNRDIVYRLKNEKEIIINKKIKK